MPSSSEDSSCDAKAVESGRALDPKSPKGISQPTAALALARVGGYEFTGKVLGRGNFARVEEGIHTRMQVKVAVKVVDTARIREEYVARHLEREARMLARLRHPSIAALFETLRAGACYYLVGELAPGGDLCALVRRQRGGRLEERAARRLARQLASALAHMHSRGVVHRDLKMENIMLDASGRRIKIVDFGLSNAWTPGQPLRTHCGSPEYAAPELFVAGRAYGPEVDLWSLGVVLFGMLAGRLPFLGPRAQEGVSSPERRARLLEQINRGLTGPQRRLLSHASPDFVHLERRLLTQDATTRACVGEVLAHPWMTARGAMPPPRADPLPALTTVERAQAARVAAHALGMPRSRLLAEAAASRFGPAGGAFNIAVHLMTEQRIESSVASSAATATVSATTTLTPPPTPPPASLQPAFGRRVSTASGVSRQRSVSPTTSVMQAATVAASRPQSSPAPGPAAITPRAVAANAAAGPPARPATATPGRSPPGRMMAGPGGAATSSRQPSHSPRMAPSPRPGSTFFARAPSPTLAARCSEALRLFHERATRGRRLGQTGSGMAAVASYLPTPKCTISGGNVLAQVASSSPEGGGVSLGRGGRRPVAASGHPPSGSSRQPSRTAVRPATARPAPTASRPTAAVATRPQTSGGVVGMDSRSTQRSATVRRSRQTVPDAPMSASGRSPTRPSRSGNVGASNVHGVREQIRDVELPKRPVAEITQCALADPESPTNAPDTTNESTPVPRRDMFDRQVYPSVDRRCDKGASKWWRCQAPVAEQTL